MAPGTKAADWAYVSGLVAAREARMLPKAFFRQLAAEADLDGVLHRLSETVFRDRLHGAADLQRLDAIAAQVLAGCVEELRGLCPSDAAICHFDVRNVFTDLRRFARRADAQGEEDREPALSPYGDAVWKRLWADMPTDVPDYVRLAAERARRALRDAPDRPEVLDAVIDSLCLRALCDEAQRRGNAFITGYWHRHDTARGVEALWRARTLELDSEVQDLLVADRKDSDLFAGLARAEEEDWPDLLGVSVGGVALGRLRERRGTARIREFARAADAGLADYVGAARSVPFGSERVFGYAVGIEAEVFNLKVVVGGRAAGIVPELLDERLRACYV